jgi:hypothetical protein
MRKNELAELSAFATLDLERMFPSRDFFTFPESPQ